VDVDFEEMGDDDVIGAATITDLTWKGLLDTYTCTECGRCQSACPAWNTGKPLSPKLLVMELRDHLMAAGPGLVAPRRRGRRRRRGQRSTPTSSTTRWSGTAPPVAPASTNCPVDIEHIDHIIDMRRNS